MSTTKFIFATIIILSLKFASGFKNDDHKNYQMVLANSKQIY